MSLMKALTPKMIKDFIFLPIANYFLDIFNKVRTSPGVAI